MLNTTEFVSLITMRTKNDRFEKSICNQALFKCTITTKQTKVFPTKKNKIISYILCRMNFNANSFEFLS